MVWRAAARTVVAIASVAAAGGSGNAGEADDTGPDQAGVIGGETSALGAYPATGILLKGNRGRCTATLIAPDVAITAAHCLEDEGFGDFSFSLDPDLTDGTIDGAVGVLVTHQHPGFHKDYRGLGQRNDLGVVILDSAMPGVPYERLDSPDLRSGVAAGSTLAMVGYGRDFWSARETDGIKRNAVVMIDQVSDWELSTTADDPQPCTGDSGGPLFVETSNGPRITALVSRATGDSVQCDTGSIATNVGPYVEWITDASADRDTGCAASGGGDGVEALVVFALGLLGLCWRRPRRRQR